VEVLRQSQVPPLAVPSQSAVERFAIEFVRNRLAARPAPSVLLPSREAAPWLHEWWEQSEHGPGKLIGASGSTAVPFVDLAIVAGDAATWSGTPESARVRCAEALLLPGATPDSVEARQSVLELRVGAGGRTILLVPGTGASPDHRLTPAALARLREAEAIARAGEVRGVVLSGWGGSMACESEGQQLMEAWQGPPVPLIVDPAARTTAENAVCSAALLRGLPDLEAVVLVTSWSNALRQHLAAVIAFQGMNMRVTSKVLWGLKHSTSLRPGLVGLIRLRRHLMAARALLKYGPSDPRANP
jgi:uncharacterized SAM-binding protein YcdF (DUF218 family)